MAEIQYCKKPGCRLRENECEACRSVCSGSPELNAGGDARSRVPPPDERLGARVEEFRRDLPQRVAAVTQLAADNPCPADLRS